VTRNLAQTLGLKIIGSGKSYGSGGGSTPTRFTTIEKLEIGDARIVNQPFTVLYLDLGRTQGAGGSSVPIAGILGLECRAERVYG
jgi:hypothetical protein